MKTVNSLSCNVIAILIVGGVLYGFYLKPKYEGEG
jgi:hypothetical protein